MDYQYSFDFAENRSAEYLYRSLGSFWSDIFQEKATIKGYTLGVAEEMVQRYFDLVETINAYSVKDINIFHREKWKAITLYKSKINQQPFVFEEGHAVFGVQPDLDEYYGGAVFQFGKAKVPTSDIYTYYVGDELINFGVLADRILDPSVVLTYGNDVKIVDKALFFNKNIFEMDEIPKFKLIGENGVVQTYADSSGAVLEEEVMVLWAYNGTTSKDALYYNFGYIFNLQFENDQFFKDLLISLFAINVNGPTVNTIKRCCAAFMEAPISKHPVEIVEDIFQDSVSTYVVTDKECYKFSSSFNLASNITVGATLIEGSLITNSIAYYDGLSAGTSIVYGKGITGTGWWLKDGLIDGRLAVSKYLFYGTYTHQLLFANELAVIAINEDGDIVFPVEGNPDDVATFHSYINVPARRDEIKSKLGLVNPGDTYVIVPVNFLLENFLKNNTAMLKFEFYNDKQRSRFLSILPIIKSQLPPYIYLILKVDLIMDTEVYEELNDTLSISFDSGTQVLSADGSNTVGLIEELSPYGYKDVRNRLFELSLAIKLDPDNALPYDYVLTEDTEATPDGDAEADGRIVTIREGQITKPIPAGVSTAQYGNLLLLDFTN